MTIEQQLVCARKGQGLSAREVAERAGMTQVQLSQIEHARGRPRIDTIERVAKAVGMRLVLVPE